MSYLENSTAAAADEATIHADDADDLKEIADDPEGRDEHADESGAAAVGVRVLPLLALDSRAMGAWRSHGSSELSHWLWAFWSRALKRKTGNAKLLSSPVKTVTSVAWQYLC